MKCMLKDAARALSLANLCFILTWNELINSPIRRFNTCLAVVINVLALAAIFWIAVTLARRSRHSLPLRLARFVFPLVTLLTLNGFFRILMPEKKVFVEAIVIIVAVVIIGLFEVMPWHGRIIRAVSTLVLVLWPFSLITVGQALWALIDRSHQKSAPPLVVKNGSSPRALWLVFDEMDQHVAFSNRPASLQLTELDRLRSQSIYAVNAYPPSDSTPISMPALITGKLLSNSELISQSKMTITPDDSKQPVDWGREPNLFSRAREAGFNTALIGWYLPYCHLIGETLTSCLWVDYEETTLRESIFRQGLGFASTVPIASAFILLRGTQAKSRGVPSDMLDSYLGMLRVAKEAASDPSLSLVLVHWPVPHPPGIFDRHKNRFETRGESSYLDNLYLVDQTLAELRRTMEDTGQWDDTIVLVTSDHWWRTHIWQSTEDWTLEDEQTMPRQADHRVPFILKLAGQKQAVTYEPEFNTVLTHDLMLALLRGELPGSDSVVDWLDRHRSIGESPFRFTETK